MFLKNLKIGLRPISKEDITPSYLGWLNDQEVCAQNSHAYFPYSIEQLSSFVEKSQHSSSDLRLAIIELEKNVHIGNVSLQNINWINRSAEFAILMGEKDYWGKGYGYEAAYLLFNHGFSHLNLNRIYCGTTNGNEGMKKIAMKIGMIQEGVRRQAFYKWGKYQDIIEYGILKDEFLNNLSL